MDNKSKQVEQEVKQWLDDNREQLPINIDSWKILVTAKGETENPQRALALGKYNTTVHLPNNFYKPYSRLVKIQNG